MVAHMPTTPPGDLPYEGDYDQGWHSAHPQLPPGSERAYKAGCRCQACNGEQAGREFAALMDTLADTAIHGRAGWRPLAACRNVPVEDRHIFLTEEGGQSARLIARAKRVCAECPVIAECLLWWLENPDRDAIYAGAGGKDQRPCKKPNTCLAMTRSSTARLPNQPAACQGVNTTGSGHPTSLDGS